jgi:hypothetical protein
MIAISPELSNALFIIGVDPIFLFVSRDGTNRLPRFHRPLTSLGRPFQQLANEGTGAIQLGSRRRQRPK